jgi:hypothetical protein
MISTLTGRLASIRLRTVVVVALLASLALAPSALAKENHPKGGFAVFAQCPLANPAIELCTIANTESGEFTIGKKTVPINKTITLQAGLKQVPETEERELVAAENGETLSKTALTVPGGLFGIIAPEYLPKWLQEIINNFVNEGFSGVTETTELALPASDARLNLTALFSANGTALKLPTKVKLNNSLLGNECYVGSASSPVTLNLTTGTTKPPEGFKPITGAVGTLSFEEESAIGVLTGGALVDNTWSAPGAHGCGGFLLEGLLDPAVDAELGLPSSAGHNVAILKGTLKIASAEAVRASEK